jgi:hypothetical protein
MKGKTQTHYDSNPESKKKKAKYDKEFNKKPEQRAKRSELTTRNRKADEKGIDRKGKDFDHAVGKYVKSSVNRGRKEKSRLKK